MPAVFKSHSVLGRCTVVPKWLNFQLILKLFLPFCWLVIVRFVWVDYTVSAAAIFPDICSQPTFISDGYSPLSNGWLPPTPHCTECPLLKAILASTSYVHILTYTKRNVWSSSHIQVTCIQFKTDYWAIIVTNIKITWPLGSQIAPVICNFDMRLHQSFVIVTCPVICDCNMILYQSFVIVTWDCTSHLWLWHVQSFIMLTWDRPVICDCDLILHQSFVIVTWYWPVICDCDLILHQSFVIVTWYCTSHLWL